MLHSYTTVRSANIYTERGNVCWLGACLLVTSGKNVPRASAIFDIGNCR